MLPCATAGAILADRFELLDFLGQGAYGSVYKAYDRIPVDSDAAIFTAGLLGGQYVGIGPGGSETYFRDGGQIQLTQSAVVLENLISKFLFQKAAEGGDKPATEGNP